jgi:XTP/dITP diphosphohydrolase
VIVFATRNQGKLKELQALVGGEVKSLFDFGDVDVAEDAETFEGNAEKKARVAFELSGLPSVGDDSGLEVEALGGAPGVHSARFAGDHDYAANNRKLLEVMRGQTNRRARFRCVMVYLAKGKRIVVEGRCEGSILEAARGSEGFGYDPLFLVEGTGKSMAELWMEEKNRVSHRGRAFVALQAALRGE